MAERPEEERPREERRAAPSAFEEPPAAQPYDEDPDDTVSLLRTASGPGDDEEGDTTVVRSGGRRTRGVLAPEPTADEDDTARVDRTETEDDEATIVVGEPPADDAQVPADASEGDEPDDTVIVDEEPVAPETAALTVDTSTTQPADDSTGDPSDSDDTVAVARVEPGTGLDDDTIAVARDEDATHEVVRDDDPTALAARAAAERTRPADPTRTEGDVPANRVDAGSAAVKPVMIAPKRRRRRALKPAPVPPGYGGRAVLAAGAGAVSTYRVREIPRPPASVQPLATRSVERLAGGLTSVSKRSRRLAVLTMSGFGLSIVVSLVGLALIARSAILGY